MRANRNNCAKTRLIARKEGKIQNNCAKITKISRKLQILARKRQAISKPAPELAFKAIEDVLLAHPEGASRASIAEALGGEVSPRTLQSRLQFLVGQGRVTVEGQGRSVKYRLADPQSALADGLCDVGLLLSDEAKAIQRLVLQPLTRRKPVGYNRDFLESYRPNETAYLSASERERLHEIGKVPIGSQPACTYARQIIDLSLIHI